MDRPGWMGNYVSLGTWGVYWRLSISDEAAFKLITPLFLRAVRVGTRNGGVRSINICFFVLAIKLTLFSSVERKKRRIWIDTDK